MTRRSARGPAETDLRRRRIAVSAVAVLSVAVVVLMALLDTTRVQTNKELHPVAFGMPFNWLVQSQVIDPPVPDDTRFISPWENPTTIDGALFLLDVATVAAVLLGGFLVVRAVRTKLGSRTPAS